MCGVHVSCFKRTASDKYEKMKGVTKGNMNESIANELKCCVNQMKH